MGRTWAGRGRVKRMSEVAGDDTASESSNPPSPATSPEISEHGSDEEGSSTSSRPPRQRTLPVHFCQDSTESDNDGAVCMLCDSN